MEGFALRRRLIHSMRRLEGACVGACSKQSAQNPETNTCACDPSFILLRLSYLARTPLPAMDLEPYALTHAESASAASTASPNDKGKGKAAEEAGTGVDVRPAEELPTIEQDVKQLVLGVSSWWTGFSQKASTR